VILNFAVDRDFFKARETQQAIILAYENDFSKHAPVNQLPRIRMVWQSIVGQLAKENSKFIYSLLRTGARAKEFETAIDWLKDAGLIHKVVRISKPGMPVSAYADWSDFKIYLNDVGLLSCLAGVSQNSMLHGNDFFEEFKGVIAEQFICQQIKSQSITCYYWSPEGGTSEVDFIIQRQDQIVPIEVKSGLNVRSRSLRVYYDKYNPQMCIRTSPNDYEEQSWMTNIPLFSFLSWLKTPPTQTDTQQTTAK
jgi:predicted AAA+ superfamily ATPase